MSTIAVSYSDLGHAADEASGVAKRLSSYASEINNKIIGKLNSYSGPATGNISTAKTYAANKYYELQDAQKRYNTYSTNLRNLREDCKKTDKGVATRIKSLTGTFKAAHNININPVTEFFGNLLTSIKNSNPVFRWISNNVIDPIKNGFSQLKGAIKEWWDYMGGKQWAKGTLEAVAEIAIAVAGLVVAIVTFPVSGVIATVVAIAGIIGGAIALVDGITNLINEQAALYSRCKGDASMGYRLSKLDNYTSTLKTFSDSKFVHIAADVIDGVKFVCDVIDFIDTVKTFAVSGAKMIKNGYKWATGSLDNIKNLKLKDILTRQNLSTFGNKLKTGFKNSFDSIKSAVKTKDWTFFKTAAGDFGTDFMKSLKEKYFNFSTIEKGAKSVKNIASMAKKVIDSDGLGGLALTAVKAIGGLSMSSITMATINTAKTDASGAIIKDSNGKAVIDIKEIAHVKVDNIHDLCSKPIKFATKAWGFGKKLVKTFSSPSKVRVSIPEIYVPKVTINVRIEPVHIWGSMAA